MAAAVVAARTVTLDLGAVDANQVAAFSAAVQAASGTVPPFPPLSPASGPLVLVALDADLGTYPEIRYATRAALSDLLNHGSRLAFVSFSPEGRAISVAEQQRLRAAGVAPARILDLGYVPGAEAGLVRSVTTLLPGAASGQAPELRQRPGLGAFGLVVVVAGMELGPRSWVEQVRPRLPKLAIVAIAPTFLQPELQPYLRTGQLRAALATYRDGIAYGREVAGRQQLIGRASGPPPETPPRGLPILVGMLIAIALLGSATARHLARRARGWRPQRADR